MDDDLKKVIDNWLNSRKRKEMLVSKSYFNNKTAIHKKTTDGDKSDIHASNNMYNVLVRQKVDYLVGKKLSINIDDDNINKVITNIYSNKLHEKIKKATKECIIKGVAYIHPYIQNNELKLKVYNSEEIIVFYKDDDMEYIDFFIRVYEVNECNKIITKVEKWDSKTVEYYTYKKTLILDKVEPNAIILGTEENPEAFNFTRVPLIRIKYNDDEIPLLNYVKELIDAYDYILSTSSDILIDIPKFTYVVKGYMNNSTQRSKFLSELKKYHAIFTQEGGSVDKLNADVDMGNSQTALQILKDAVFLAGMGVDLSNTEIGNVSGVALQFKYGNLDLDVADLSSNILSALDDLLFFMNIYSQLIYKIDLLNNVVEFSFNVKRIVSESEIIDNLNKSVSFISQRTYLANHPYVADVNKELEQIQSEEENQLMYSNFSNDNIEEADANG